MTDPQKILFSAVKNEGPFLVEWIAYHRVIGFDRIVIVSNDSDDGTTELLDGLHAAGVIHHIHHSVGPDESPQGKAARVGNESGLFGDGDWVLWIDADEFLNIHAGQGRLDDLLALMGEAQGMLIPWRLFGDSGNATFPGRFISRDFRRASAAGQKYNYDIKTLFKYRAGVLEFSPIVHRPVVLQPDQCKNTVFLNTAGLPIDEGWKSYRDWLDGIDGGSDYYDAAPPDKLWTLVQINHYAVRTPDVYALKKSRGRGFQPGYGRKVRHTDLYYKRRNRNGRKDISILRHETATTREIETLKALPGIAELHQDTCRRTAERIAELHISAL